MMVKFRIRSFCNDIFFIKTANSHYLLGELKMSNSSRPKILNKKLFKKLIDFKHYTCLGNGEFYFTNK